MTTYNFGDFKGPGFCMSDEFTINGVDCYLDFAVKQHPDGDVTIRLDYIAYSEEDDDEYTECTFEELLQMIDMTEQEFGKWVEETVLDESCARREREDSSR